MARTKPDLPPYRVHKATGQGYVTLDGERRYLGRADDPATRKRYDRTVAEWLSAGRRLHVDATDLTVVELAAAFLRHAERHYLGADGKLTFELANHRQALRPLNELYGDSKATAFGPLALKSVRNKMIELGWCRPNVNKMVGRLKHVFKWAASEELIPASVFHGLQTVSGLQRGRTQAREPEPVKPVADATIEATIQQMTPTLAAMVRLQRLTGMRPAEVCGMRGCDLDTTGKHWVYRPPQHKTAYRGRAREVFVGPKGQAVLKPFLQRDTQANLFSPEDSERERRETMHANRVTPLSCGNRPGTNKVRHPQKELRNHYTTDTYGQAVAYACERAFPVPDGLIGDGAVKWRKEHRWTPNQLRHSFATEVRRRHGLEAAQVLLGHSKADVTQIYAERDLTKAASVALKIG